MTAEILSLLADLASGGIAVALAVFMAQLAIAAVKMLRDAIGLGGSGGGGGSPAVGSVEWAKTATDAEWQAHVNSFDQQAVWREDRKEEGRRRAVEIAANRN